VATAIIGITTALAFAARAQEASPGSEDLPVALALEATVLGDASRDPGATTTTGEKAAQLAGAHGDALVAGQSLPGIARPPFGSGQLVIWGASPKETKLLIDGIEVPALYHLGGLRSVVPTELVGQLQLHPGAFGAGYGRALGGVLNAELALPELRGDPRFVAAVDPLDAHASAEVPLGASRVFAGARYSLLDRILTPALSDDAKALLPLPRAWDAQLLATVPLRSGESLELIALGSSDSSQRMLDVTDAAASRGDRSELRWARLGARYRQALDGGAEASVLLWFGDELQSQRLFYGAYTSDQIRWAQSGGLRASWTSPLAKSDSASADLTLGLDALYTRTTLHRSGSLTSPPREGDVSVFGEPPGTADAFDSWRVGQGDAAIFAESHLSFRDLDVTLGLRATGAPTDVSRVTPRAGATPQVGLDELEWFLDPRAALQLHATERLRFFAAAGLHHQPADPQDLSAVFGTPTLGSSRALHALAGAGLRAFSLLELEASGFVRALEELPSRSALPTPQLAQALVQEGTGKVLGVQLIARTGRSGGWSGFVSALMSRSTRQDRADSTSRLFDFDQPFLLTAAADWKSGDNLVSVSFRLASGSPRTPVLGAYLDSQTGLDRPIFGAQNSDRLPLFAQLDLRAAHKFSLGPQRFLQLALDVLNLTDRANAEELVYSSNWQHRGALTGLPLAALLGVELVL
jgi:hypothetical protein